nr:hypothetical protein [Tanacetum cinerariifolium]
MLENSGISSLALYGVVEMDMGLYPWDFGACCRLKGEEDHVTELGGLGGKGCTVYSVLNQDKAATSLVEFKLKKILLDKIEKSKSYQAAPEHRELYDGLPKLFGKSTQAEEPVFEAANTKMKQDQGSEFVHTVDKPNGKAAPKSDCNIAKAREPPCMFDEIMSAPINFSAYVMNHLKIGNLTQEILNNPKGHGYPFDLSKPLSLIKVQGRQVVPADYFFNNDLEYLKGGSSSRKYITSTTKTKTAKYDNIKGIKDMVLTLWSPVKVAYEQYAMWGGSSSRKYTTSTTKTKAAKYDNIEGIEDMVLTLWGLVKVAYDLYALLAASLGLKETLQPRERCHLRPECGIEDVHQTRCHS